MTTPESASTPRPDPTSLTTDALQREIGQLRELLESKMDALDTKMTGHFLLDADRFSAIAEQFRVIESQRVEQKRDTQDALTAALTAQKEAVAKQDEANQKAISKSEVTTADTLNKLSELFKTTTDALRDKIEDVKSTANGTVQQKLGGTENRTATFAVIGMVVTIGFALLTIVGFVLANAP